jgi:hypothetical protein
MYSTPTSTGSVGMSSMGTFSSFVNNDVNDFPVQPLSVETRLASDGVSYIVKWSAAYSPELITQIDVQQYVTGAWTTIGVVYPPFISYGPVEKNGIYRIVVTKNEPKVGIEHRLSRFVSTPSVRFPDPSTTVTSVGNIYYRAEVSSISDFNVMNRTLVVVPMTSTGTLSTTISTDTNYINNYNTITRTLIALVLPDIPLISEGAVSSYADQNKITNYTVSQIGGVVIGG